jgi:hypothetical protein
MNEQEILNQFERFTNLLKKFFDSSNIESLVSDLGERIATSPAGLTLEEGGYPGALVDRSLRVANFAKKLVSSMEIDLDPRSVVKVALIAELGRIGDLDNDLYLPQTSEWHREKLGQNYKYNENCSKSTIPHRTLFLVQHYNLKLSFEEWLAVLTYAGFHQDETKFYGNKKNELMEVIQLSKHLALKSIKDSQ